MGQTDCSLHATHRCPTQGLKEHTEQSPTGLLLNLGCGTNKLSGWLNHDADVDVTQPLPWGEGAAYYIFIEHCIEHVSCHQAIGFFEEAFRVLSPGGVLRVVVLSVESKSLRWVIKPISRLHQEIRRRRDAKRRAKGYPVLARTPDGVDRQRHGHPSCATPASRPWSSVR